MVPTKKYPVSANTAEVQKLWSKKVRSQSQGDPRAALYLDWMTRLEWGENLPWQDQKQSLVSISQS